MINTGDAHLAGSGFWSGKRVLLTGHTGFKGAWLSLWLSRLGARVFGVALAPEESHSLFYKADIESRLSASYLVDIRDSDRLRKVVDSVKPEVVFHLAAQSLVREGYDRPVETFSTNVQGTVNLLDALRAVKSVRTCVVVTTDKVYQNIESFYPYRETDPLGGKDPYSASKAATEMVVGCYRDAFYSVNGTALSSARAGNVIGGGDWAKDRLIPDAMKAWRKGMPLVVRNPDSVRPWQHVMEPLYGYLVLAEKTWVQPSLAGSYNFGPSSDSAATVRSVIRLANEAYGGGEVQWRTDSTGPHEAGLLLLDVSRARHILGVTGKLPLGDAIKTTVDWYRKFDAGEDAGNLCEKDISSFESILDRNNCQ